MGAVLFAYMLPAANQAVVFSLWYPEHIASRLAVPGFRKASLFVEGDPPQRRVTVYSLDSTEVLDSEAYRALRAQTHEETEHHIGGLADFVRVVGRVVDSSSDGSGDPRVLPGAKALSAFAVVASSDSVQEVMVTAREAWPLVVLEVDPVGSNIEATHLLLIGTAPAIDDLDARASISESLTAVGCGIVWSADLSSAEHVIVGEAQ